ncbi:AAA family ATPase [Candidatus Albibeggiatoa sp. nov. NOAA]|uniref:AAA family ATPase n=1 Tax=Candidatus Albibeggiatoa sp. nov. NOAA TaxID=3162724 RepID=UPI0032F78973|nr:AAA family ATPase [Thiotrichaceae bacterium]
MRINQLELSAYGSFTNKILDLSQNHGLHIIYGHNEAGKSTTRRAINAVLFGIPERTQDAYYHSNDKLRIGAKLQDGDAFLHIYRRKGRKNTLLSTDNEPIDEELLKQLLGSISETQYNALFCLNHERLVQGGEDLLNGGGNIGESLFEAGTGTLKLHELLADLDKEADTLFKARGSKPKLNQTIKSYKEACQKVKNSTLPASKFKDYDTRLEQAHATQNTLNQQLQNVRAEQARLARIQRTRPLLQRYNELQQQLATLQDTVILPEDAKAQRIEANLALHTAQAQVKQSRQLIEQLQIQLAAITIPSELLGQKSTIDTLREQLGSHLKAARDLPGVRTERRTVENEAQQLLKRVYPQLALHDLADLAITDPQREQIKELADSYPTLREKQANILERLDKTTQQFLHLQKNLELLPNPPDLTQLKAALNRALKQGDLEQLLAKDDKEVRLLTSQAEISLKQLGLWMGTLDELEQLPLPNLERIETFDRRFKDLENDRQRIKEKLLDARQRYTVASQKIDALRWAGEVPTESMLIQARQDRDQRWQSLKHAQPTQDMFQGFEQAMKRVDELSDRLRREAHRVAEQAAYMAERDSAKHEQENQTRKWRKSDELLAELQTEWENCWHSAGIKPWSPTEMRGWLTECLALRQQINLLRERRQQLEVRQELIADLCHELSQALAQLPEGVMPLTRLIDLIEQAQASIDEVNQLTLQRDDLSRQIKMMDNEQQRWALAKEQIQQALDDWQRDWLKAIEPLQLEAETRPETVRNVLDTLDKILNKLDKINGLKRRVERMEEDAVNFKNEVNKVLTALVPEWVDQEVEQVIPKLSARLSQAEKDATLYEQVQQRLQAEQQDLNKAQIQNQQAQVKLDALLSQAHCTNLAELEQAEQYSLQKQALLHDERETKKRLSELGEGMSINELAEDVNSVDMVEVPALLQQTQEHIQQLESERSELDQTIGELRTLLKQMDGNDAAAQAADEAQLALAEMQDLSERYMQVTLAASVLRKSIDRYREQHQAPLLSRASELFNHLTLGSFQRLRVGYNSSDQPIILGARLQEDEGIPTTAMSDGTRDQLYLALRLASIEHYLQKNITLPLVLDDILINFDDLRSKATLEILSQLSQKMQILFFTHHTRLVEIAEQCTEQLWVHELG